jgi:hypothetical protein
MTGGDEVYTRLLSRGAVVVDASPNSQLKRRG